MPRHSEIEANALKIDPGTPARNTVFRLLREHKTILTVANILGVSESALFRYIEKNHIAKEVDVRWVDKLPN